MSDHVAARDHRSAVERTAGRTESGGNAGLDHHTGRGRWLGLATLAAGVSMIIIDATIVNVAIPVIIKDLSLDLTTAEWMNTIYVLVFAALLVTFGRLGDVLGRRRMFLAGMAVFLGASVMAGAASDGPSLIAARLAQGIGGAAILPVSLSIINASFQGRDRNIAFGVWGSVIGGMAALGPLVGGWLTTNLSWRWAFYINIPVAAVVFVGTVLYVSESRDERAERSFDFPGFAFLTVGLLALVFGLVEGYSYGWWGPSQSFTILGWTWPLDAISIIPFAIGGGLVFLAAFVIVELRRERAGRTVLFEFGLWRYRSFSLGNIIGALAAFGQFGLIFSLPLFLSAVSGYSAFDTGLLLLPMALGSFVAGPLAATFAQRFGPRGVVLIGMGLEVLGFVGVAVLIAAEFSAVAMAVPLVAYGIGIGFASAQLTNIILADVPPEKSGLASGANSMTRQVGSALGVAVIGSVLAVTLGSGVRDRLAAVPGLPPQAVDGIATAIERSGGQALAGFRGDASAAPVVAAADAAFVDAVRVSTLAGTGALIIGFVLCFPLPNPGRRTRRIDDVAGGDDAARDDAAQWPEYGSASPDVV